MPRARRMLLTALGAAAWWLLSCREIPAPEGGIAAVSPILLPLPSVVVGDTMRDSLGVVAPIRVIAYGVDGEPLSSQPPASFIVVDSGGAHFAGALLVGDSIGDVVIVGIVGPLQSRRDTVKVTLSPDTLVAADSVLHRKTYSVFGGDTVSLSGELAVRVEHFGVTDTTGVEGVIVRYAIDHMPVGNGSGPSVVLANGNIVSSRDTTDGSGRASRIARLRFAALGASTVDTVLVSATASYRGFVIGTVPFAIIFTKQP